MHSEEWGLVQAKPVVIQPGEFTGHMLPWDWFFATCWGLLALAGLTYALVAGLAIIQE